MKPSELSSDCLGNYQFYRLMNTSHVGLAEEPRKLREQVKTFWTTHEDIKFSGDDPNLELDFLTRFVEDTDALGVFEAREFLIMPKLLTDQAKRFLQSIHSGT